MNKQSEAALENKLIDQLKSLDYSYVTIGGEESLLSNLKARLEQFNTTTFSDKEFKAIVNHLSRGNVFTRAKTLRDRFQFYRDNGESVYISFFDYEDWNNNIFQVTNQVTTNGVYTNRYDVTILINGLPLVQIELKRRGLELKGGIQPDQPLPAPLLLGRLRALSIYPDLCHLQRGQHQVLCQQ
jgi:type I restriction enzyme R subunit